MPEPLANFGVAGKAASDARAVEHMLMRLATVAITAAPGDDRWLTEVGREIERRTELFHNRPNPKLFGVESVYDDIVRGRWRP